MLYPLLKWFLTLLYILKKDQLGDSNAPNSAFLLTVQVKSQHG